MTPHQIYCVTKFSQGIRSKMSAGPYSQKFKMENFLTIVNGFKPLIIFTKSSILDIWVDYECTSDNSAEVLVLVIWPCNVTFSLKCLLTHFMLLDSFYIYALKRSENERFSNAFRGFRNGPVEWNGLIPFLPFP